MTFATKCWLINDPEPTENNVLDWHLSPADAAEAFFSDIFEDGHPTTEKFRVRASDGSTWIFEVAAKRQMVFVATFISSAHHGSGIR
jgi:hypothetical protein